MRKIKMVTPYASFQELKPREDVWKWAEENQSDMLSQAYTDVCVLVGGLQPELDDKDMWNIREVAMQLRDSIGRLIIKKMKKCSQ